MLLKKFGCKVFLTAFFVLAGVGFLQAAEKALILQEMTWADIESYLIGNDMVIIPIGSTEQHGLHLPLGTDYYEALGIVKKVSEQTGVVVAPVILAGYSEYHSGFPGTLSLKPETMEQVVWETALMLMKYGFKKFLFFNFHGGNRVIQQKIINRINQNTKATAVDIGSPPIQKEEEEEIFDGHAGVEETSIMLYLEPALVRMERAQNPEIHLTPEMKELQVLSSKYPEIMVVWQALVMTPAETQKGGSSCEMSSNGVLSFADLRTASAEKGERVVKGMVEQAVKFIETWKQAKVK